MCFLPSLSKKLGEAVGVEKPYDASLANNLFGEDMGNPDYLKKPPPLDPPNARRNPVAPFYDPNMWRGGSQEAISGVHTSARGARSEANQARLLLAGEGTANAPGAPTHAQLPPPPPPPPAAPVNVSPPPPPPPFALQPRRTGGQRSPAPERSLVW